MPDVIIRLAKEGLAQEEITAKTMMPAEVVAAILQAVN